MDTHISEYDIVFAKKKRSCKIYTMIARKRNLQENIYILKLWARPPFGTIAVSG